MTPTESWGPSSLHRVQAAGASNVGRRSNNEDAFLLAPEHGVFVVADGMGGYEGGEVASRIVVETVASFFDRNAADDQLTWPFGIEPGRSFVANELAVALRLANLEILRRRRGRLERMGSTVVAAALDHAQLIVAHAGDSRAYLSRGAQLHRLTVDHSLVEQLRAMGTAEVPEGLGHVVTKVLGCDPEVRPDVRVFMVARGDRILLCSDGLTDALDDEAIHARLVADDTMAAIADALVSDAYAAGGADNITAVILRVAG